jgi:NAD(P)-dependent dehydrogenase (short-subunit alcohol dehydrogenase family)
MHPTPHHPLVTGGTETRGLAVVRRLATEGHSVTAICLAEDEGRETAERDRRVVFERVDPLKLAQVVDLGPSPLQGLEGQAVDAPAKARVLGLGRALAREVGPLAIALCAGANRMERATRAYSQQLEALVRRTPLRRAGTADEVAGMVDMPCEDEAGGITGQSLSIDGGLN